ncbi:hypothetical protein PDL71_01185 [Lacibacter sp. MH-610]|uniref:hypothetical protein n=1 Tax=Lacibacter sp. MH-610 TaxID=3020883 RepID=UPI003892763A
MFPTIAEYNQTIQAKGGNAFKTLSNLTFIPSRTVPVRIYSYGSGSYAVVFKAKEQYKEFAIRCFISAEKENIDRYRSIDSYLKNISASWITKTQLLEDEINIGYQHYPVIKMDWVEGQLLNNFITQVIDNNFALTELQNEVVSVSKSLEFLKVGHGDIQCGNIIVAKNVDGRNIIKLIDYDGMYIPSFSNKVNLERGRTEFQHPNRSQIQYNEKIDRFSFWVILCAIEALKFDKTLWFEVMKGGFNTLDNLLFIGDDFKYFNNSKLVNRLYALNQPSLTFYLNKLNKFCNSLPDSVEPPTIFDSSGQIIENIIPQPVPTEIFGSTIEIITSPIGAAVLTPTFQRIGITPLKIDKEKYIGKTLVISYGTQFKQVPIEQSTTIIDLHFNEKVNSFQNLNQSHQVNSLEQSYESVPPLQTVQTPVKSETDNSGWIIFGIIAVIFFAVIVVASVNKQNASSYTSSVDNSGSYNTTPSTSYIDTTAAVVDTFAYPAADTTAAIIAVDTTAAAILTTTEDNSTSFSYKDDYDMTSEQAVKVFLGALANKDCEAAWNITYNPTWEIKGKVWFCSYEAFGGVTKVLLGDIHTISQGYTEAEIYVNYYTEDIYNGNKCYKQKIVVKKTTFDNNKSRWMIARMVNIETPYDCQVNE